MHIYIGAKYSTRIFMLHEAYNSLLVYDLMVWLLPFLGLQQC